VSVILFWFRQADNTMTAIHGDHVARFHAFLNSVHENIKWTFESKVDGCIDMLTSPSCASLMVHLSLTSSGNPHTPTNTLLGTLTNTYSTRAPPSFPSPDAPASSPLVIHAKQLNSGESTKR
jgi:hypothetical protein